MSLRRGVLSFAGILLVMQSGAVSATTPRAGQCRSEGAVPAQQRLSITWTEIDATPGCFFFSGPGDRGARTRLGATATLTIAGSTASLDFGDGVRFTGTVVRGDVSLRREASYDFQNVWKVTETITGSVRGNAFAATYRYHECEHGTQCPNHCTHGALINACGAEVP